MGFRDIPHSQLFLLFWLAGACSIPMGMLHLVFFLAFWEGCLSRPWLQPYHGNWHAANPGPDPTASPWCGQWIKELFCFEENTSKSTLPVLRDCQHPHLRAGHRDKWAEHIILTLWGCFSISVQEFQNPRDLSNLYLSGTMQLSVELTAGSVYPCSATPNLLGR